MKIEFSHPGILFATFYILSFAITFAIVIIFSLKRKIPLRSVLLMMTTVSLLTIIGSRLFTIPLLQWGHLIGDKSFSGEVGRSAVGGLVFGLAGLVFSRKVLGIGMPIFTLYAWLAPLGFGIQKIGCFLNGCCFGNISDVPWSVQYATGTNAHFHQWSQGIIPENAAYSLSVHPVQLYEALSLFLISFIVWRTRHTWKRNGSILVFSLCLFFLFRFANEFFRSSSSTYIGGESLLGIKELQWFLLLAGIFCLLLLLILGKFTKTAGGQVESHSPSLRKSISYIVILSIIIYAFRNLFSAFELAALDMKFIPAILFTVIFIYRSLPVTRIRLATSSFIVFPLLLIIQAFPQDTLKSNQTINSFYTNDVTGYTKIDFGSSFGNYYGDIAYRPQEGQCGTYYTHEDYRYEFRLGGLGFSRIKIMGRTTTTYGVNLFGGSIGEYNLTNSTRKNHFLIGIDPYINFNTRWTGIGVGLQAGNLRWIPLVPYDSYSYKNATRNFPLMPELFFRIGPKDILDLKYNYGYKFPSAFPVLSHELSLGTGLGTMNNEVRLGLDLGNSTNKFISVQALVSRQFGLNLKYDFGRSDYFDHRSSWLTLGANYRFGFK